MINKRNKTLGWGVKGEGGVEIWDAEPVFRGEAVTWKDKLKLLFYPKKWFLYGHIKLKVKSKKACPERKPNGCKVGETIRLLDVGCGTGADVIDFKKMFGRKVEVVGVDVVALEIDIAKEKIKQHGIWAEVMVYDGENLPFPDHSFDAIYTSDVLGHVKNVDGWLAELSRVLKPGGALAMFSESKLGKHAYIRNYLMRRGINTDPHAEFHISLYSKEELQEKLRIAGFAVKRMFSFVNAPGFVSNWINKRFHPYSTAVFELYGLIGMLLVGKFIETQGFVILGEKRLGEVERWGNRSR
ncbi:MAG: hypothetical protein A2921_04030 [Candidatus Magasanikbacteria bacterium RIFCSPLOWO2_01_FULL_43_20b]|uniref:Methyltransferase type 11 domain-containing protein n=1 Tax=Candidatus Magasanikbacteria bacterium RIFCSPLOWO2_12_FULL_43_12 TaxID=1798692 RepID=A0A1F6MRY9_9BACT|nr:MAG: hypothetical protein A3C74_03880 [Candidatus Magasanikbacteria bacterium RIFCSPHIGHO2_02_FULL_44_13]OGH71821.1 MAG: hypothetical protein A3I93_00160 [Candidatus Magasanikbacteria bacterium RIFCSPLOWO2_02_FULL_43_22]OGH73158.1 MAG: hypothetical protein A2921_04030 [Candidatus Magasanikbacteria bacterium RIFCSPLOWO2_01_FULL_43_20b]OGH74193.1 MAG: hypothetical protein A3G00_02975 [Candidatus Magasanikbacteria bacterium RIFCSPLOWO2_12_FULL_43_12]